jgi:hypothetical protein
VDPVGVRAIELLEPSLGVHDQQVSGTGRFLTVAEIAAT